MNQIGSPVCETGQEQNGTEFMPQCSTNRGYCQEKSPKNGRYIQFDSHRIVEAFREAIAQTGMNPPDDIEPGKINRFSDDGAHNLNGWCSLFLNPDGSAGGAFGNWKSVDEKWFYAPDGLVLSTEQKRDFSEQIRQAKEKADQERKEKQAEAAVKAKDLWDKSGPADPDGYLAKKKVQDHGTRQSGKALLIPVMDEAGNMVSLQEIFPDGTKKFLPGGRIKGGFFILGDIDQSDILYIGEGFATMATIHQVTGKGCVVAFNSGNLLAVAETFRAKYPDKKIIICADNDIETEKKTGINPGRKAGEEAAAAINAELCICPVNSDFNDLFCANGIHAVNAVQQALKKTRKVTVDSIKPLPLPDELLPVMKFDYSLLPESMQAWAQDISYRMQCPPDFVAVSIMTAMAAVIGRKVGIRPQERTDWTVVCNLWALVVGRPGVLKSPALEAGQAPLNRLIASASDRYQEEFEVFEIEEKTAKLRMESSEKEAKKILAKNSNADLSAVLAVPGVPVSPILKRYKTNDCSPASLGELLRQNPNGLMVFRDEIVSLLKGLDKEGQEEGRGFYLTAWNGDSPYTFDRIGRGLNLHIPAICISLLGGTQPGRLSEYIRAAVKGGSADDGLIQRFGLMVWPDMNGTWLNVDRYPDVNAKNQAFMVFDYLDRFQPEEIAAQQDTDFNGQPEGIPYLRFEPAALELFLEWRINLENRLRADLHPALESHFAKYRKLIPSIALIIHIADGGTGPVSETATLQALAWGEYLESHARRAYGSVSQPAVSTAKAILNRIKKGDLKTSFTSKDVWRPGWSGLSDREQVTAGLQLLEDYNHLDIEMVETAGRKKTLYHYNKAI